jgi:hypothetical protein
MSHVKQPLAKLERHNKTLSIYVVLMLISLAMLFFTVLPCKPHPHNFCSLTFY